MSNKSAPSKNMYRVTAGHFIPPTLAEQVKEILVETRKDPKTLLEAFGHFENSRDRAIQAFLTDLTHKKETK